MKHDALGAHARDELGISEATTARPIQAALASACAFALGAILPVLTVVVSPLRLVSWSVSIVSLICLAILGTVGALAGGTAPWRPALRVIFWGVMAMVVTSVIGNVFNK